MGVAGWTTSMSCCSSSVGLPRDNEKGRGPSLIQLMEILKYRQLQE